MLTNLIENVLPIDYYTTMTGVICDKNIFSDLLKVHNTKVYYKLKELELDLTIFCTNWFICLFTNTLPEKAINIVWDHLLCEGVIALFKTGLVLLDACSEQIL